jgi:hypothetical protein
LFLLQIRKKKKKKKRPKFSKLKIEGKKRNEKEKKPLITKFSNITKLGKEKTIVLSLLLSTPNLKQMTAPPLPYSKRQNKTQKKDLKNEIKKGRGKRGRIDNAKATGGSRRRCWMDGRTDGRTDGQMGGPRLQMEARVSNEGGDDGRVGLSLSRPVPQTLLLLLLLAGFRCVCGAR